jgi:hypothetical protein
VNKLQLNSLLLFTERSLISRDIKLLHIKECNFVAVGAYSVAFVYYIVSLTWEKTKITTENKVFTQAP